jgi:transcriptional regulator with XRE-family HTH domain
MNDATDMAGPHGEADALTVAGLRGELRMTLLEMGERIGLSKSQMHEVESSNRASVRVALLIEELSIDGTGAARIDAAALNADVAASRHGIPASPEIPSESGDRAASGRAVPAGSGDSPAGTVFVSPTRDAA